MVVPQTWSTPSGSTTVSGTSADPTYNYIGYIGGAWYALNDCGGAGVTKLRTAPSASGSWTVAATGDWQTAGLILSRPAEGNGEVVAVNSGAYQYTSDITGAWTEYDYSTLVNYRLRGITYDGSDWVAGGSYHVGGQKAAIGKTTTLGSSFTFYTASSETGHSSAAAISSIVYDGTRYIQASSQAYSAVPPSLVQYSTSATSGWSSVLSVGDPPSVSGLDSIRVHANGYYTVRDIGQGGIYYTDDPTGTWTLLTGSDFGFTGNINDIAWGNGVWIAAGDDSGYLRYLESDTTPDGTYTAVTSSGLSSAATSVYYEAGVWVAMAVTSGVIRYCSVLSVAARTFLRQRQSPKRAPSRVSTAVPDLRQRQTPRITG